MKSLTYLLSCGEGRIKLVQQHEKMRNKAHSPRKLSHLDAITETLPLHSTQFNTLSSPWRRNCNVCRVRPHPPKSTVLAVRQIVQNTTREHQLQPSINQQSTGESCATKCYSACLLYTSPSPRDRQKSRMPSSA